MAAALHSLSSLLASPAAQVLGSRRHVAATLPCRQWPSWVKWSVGDYVDTAVTMPSTYTYCYTLIRTLGKRTRTKNTLPLYLR